MKRTPIACCLEEGGEWKRWLPRYRLKAPIRIYANGVIEDDIAERIVRLRRFESETDFDSMACPHCGEIDGYERSWPVSPGIWMICYECRRHSHIAEPTPSANKRRGKYSPALMQRLRRDLRL